ncbi:MAG: hypothetical protein E5W76_26190, partial [Mesorhizobium sp.]
MPFDERLGHFALHIGDAKASEDTLPVFATENIVEPIEHGRRDGIGIVDRVELFCRDPRVKAFGHHCADAQVAAVIYHLQQNRRLRSIGNKPPDRPQNGAQIILAVDRLDFRRLFGNIEGRTKIGRVERIAYELRAVVLFGKHRGRKAIEGTKSARLSSNARTSRASRQIPASSALLAKRDFASSSRSASACAIPAAPTDALLASDACQRASSPSSQSPPSSVTSARQADWPSCGTMDCALGSGCIPAIIAA